MLRSASRPASSTASETHTAEVADIARAGVLVAIAAARCTERVRRPAGYGDAQGCFVGPCARIRRATKRSDVVCQPQALWSLSPPDRQPPTRDAIQPVEANCSAELRLPYDGVILM